MNHQGSQWIDEEGDVIEDLSQDEALGAADLASADDLAV